MNCVCIQFNRAFFVSSHENTDPHIGVATDVTFAVNGMLNHTIPLFVSSFVHSVRSSP